MGKDSVAAHPRPRGARNDFQEAPVRSVDRRLVGGRGDCAGKSGLCGHGRRFATTSTTITAATDWVNFINGSNIGTLTNNATIFDGFANPASPGSPGALSLYVDPTSYVGEFINDRRIYATESATPFIGNNVSTPHATATAVRFDGVVPLAANNGLISAIAYAHTADRPRPRRSCPRSRPGCGGRPKTATPTSRQVRQQRDGEGGRQRLCPAGLLRRLLGGGACDLCLWGDSSR